MAGTHTCSHTHTDFRHRPLGAQALGCMSCRPVCVCACIDARAGAFTRARTITVSADPCSNDRKTKTSHGRPPARLVRSRSGHKHVNHVRSDQIQLVNLICLCSYKMSHTRTSCTNYSHLSLVKCGLCFSSNGIHVDA